MGWLRITYLFLIVCICCARMGISFTCKEAERKALLKFKHDLMFNPSNPLGSWMGQDCCSWKGVDCDNVTSNVIKLDLRAHVNSNSSFDGKVNPAIVELKYLRYLDLSGNYLSNGSSIPAFFGSMRQLQYLNLSNTFFFGVVPHGLGNLTKLIVLDLSLGSSFRPFWSLGLSRLEWAFKLENLRYLDMSGIDLSKAHDSLNILHKLPSLSVLNLAFCGLGNHSHLVMRNSNFSSSLIHHLDLSGNLFSGPFPGFIQNLSSIRFLDLSSNQFNSPIPSWLSNKIELKYLSLGSNHFNGTFPCFIQNLSSIAFLDLSGNQFTSSIPSWMSNKKDLKQLNLSGNYFTGPFPQFIQNLSFLNVLDISSNQFSFSIPSWLASQKNLEYISLGSNKFNSVDGGIMNTISHLCRLKHLDLSYNQLQEEVSHSQVYNFSKCSRYDLMSLHMEYNNLSGHLPTTQSMLSLQKLNLSHNNFEIIPASFGKLLSLESVDLSYNHLSLVRQVHLANLSGLRNLDISFNSLTLELSPDWLPPFQLESLQILHCKLNSQFPKWLLTQEKISELDLSDTGLFGSLPDNIGNAMSFLSSLRLAGNYISGSIPKSLCELAELGFLDLHNNSLWGNIPDCWEGSQLFSVELSSNKLSGSIPSSLANSGKLQLLSLNNNSLEGELPLSLSNFPELMVLDVGNNNLHGQIPTWNGADFVSLQILILRGNKFQGMIPPQLCSISTLQIIDLASNNVSGTIPQCFGHFQGMGFVIQSNVPIASPPSSINAPVAAVEVLTPTMNPNEWTAVEVIKGQEREYTTVLHLLVNIDLSCNNLHGVIPTELALLSRLVNLNLSHNHLMGTIPKEIGKMKSLESLDLSSNNLSGSIPESISSLNYLSKLNLSLNNLQGQIPTGSQLQALNDASIYMGNPGLCGDPLPNKCFPGDIAHPPTSTLLEDEEEEDNKHEKMWFYLVVMLGFATGFWGVIGSLVVKRRWRHAYFSFAEELADWIIVRVALRIARTKGGR